MILSIGQQSDGNLKVMTSAGGLVDSKLFMPKDSLLSGPAGGVVGSANIAAKMGCEKILTFDMGGTSTDVSRFAGKFDYRFITDARFFSNSWPFDNHWDTNSSFINRTFAAFQR